jgi:hypothetical protein
MVPILSLLAEEDGGGVVEAEAGEAALGHRLLPEDPGAPVVVDYLRPWASVVVHQDRVLAGGVEAGRLQQPGGEA